METRVLDLLKKSKNGKTQGEPMLKCFSAARLGLYLLKERVYYGMLPYLVILKILVAIFLYFILKNSKIRQMFFFQTFFWMILNIFLSPVCGCFRAWNFKHAKAPKKQKKITCMRLGKKLLTITYQGKSSVRISKKCLKKYASSNFRFFYFCYS